MNANEARRLPAERAFVVQLAEQADLRAGLFTGRVEHVVSGEAANFQTVDELLLFLGRVLSAPTGRGS